MTRVVVDVMLKPEILDPQGQAVAAALPRLGVSGVSSVRVGRRIELEFDGAPDPEQVTELADRLLANPVIEDYAITIGTERSNGTHRAETTVAAHTPTATGTAAAPEPAGTAAAPTPAGTAAAPTPAGTAATEPAAAAPVDETGAAAEAPRTGGEEPA